MRRFRLPRGDAHERLKAEENSGARIGMARGGWRGPAHGTGPRLRGFRYA
jgi:hypothetical protein